MYGQNVRTNKDYRGVVRSIERDGRLSIPSEFWNRAGIQKLDKVEVLLTSKTSAEDDAASKHLQPINDDDTDIPF